MSKTYTSPAIVAKGDVVATTKFVRAEIPGDPLDETLQVKSTGSVGFSL